jgi:hypothetical protein
MKLLLIESTPGNASTIERDLRAEGHDVVNCADEHGGPCKGVQQHHDCPLEQHIDLAIVAREPNSARTLDEMGSVCAQRHRVPMVEVDPSDVADDLPSVAVANALATRRVEAGYAAAVRHELNHLPALVEVRRETECVHVTVQLPVSMATIEKSSYAADRARHAVRQHDPFVKAIDVAVITYPDPVD